MAVLDGGAGTGGGTLARGTLAGGFAALGAGLDGARGHLFPFTAVAFGCGIGGWFAVPSEPGGLAYGLLALLVVAGAIGGARGPGLLRPPAIALACFALGALVAGGRAHWVAQSPMLAAPYNGPVIGRVIAIDRSQSDALRVTLDAVSLPGLATGPPPDRVRVSLQAPDLPWQPMPGARVMLTARLAPPDGPVEPGSFDFRRMAFFDRLGAVGYTRTPVVPVDPATGRPIDRLRSHIATAMVAAMPGQAGAFATGAMTGDRSAITAETVAALRDSSLAHLLAISGMNMVFLVGFVFALVRHGLALVPPVALRVNGKKVAAVIGLGVAAYYLALSGANVATERAFIMIAVVLGAVLCDRRALSLHSVAIAAWIVMLRHPESLLDPGFQMSFAATVALIAGFGAVDRAVLRERMPRLARPVFALILSSVVAGMATAPYAGAHFNRFTDYGLIANLLTVPVMGVVVMPAGAVAALLAPFGLAAPALWLLEAGSAWILGVAHWIAALDGAVTAIPAPPPSVLPVLTLGALWLVLWPGRARWAGLAVAGLAFVLWAGADRPAVLIAGDGRLVGVMGPEGRSLSAERGAGFAARNWLENDGDLAQQAEAASRPGLAGGRFLLAGHPAIALRGTKGLGAACEEGLVVVTDAALTDRDRNAAQGRKDGAADGSAPRGQAGDRMSDRMPPGQALPTPDGSRSSLSPPPGAAPAGQECLVLDATWLARTGPIAVWPDGRIVTARDSTRLWDRPPEDGVRPGSVLEARLAQGP